MPHDARPAGPRTGLGHVEQLRRATVCHVAVEIAVNEAEYERGRAASAAAERALRA